MQSKKLTFLGQFLLLLATIVWGTSFFILKETIEFVPAFYVLTLRFLTSGLVLFFVFIKTNLKTDKKTFLQGLILGLCLSGAYGFQTVGLGYTTPARNAFLTSVYSMMVPFMMWAFFKKKPKIYNVVSAVLCVLGVGFVALSGESDKASNAFLGNLLTLICAIFYALQIIFINKFQSEPMLIENKVDGVLENAAEDARQDSGGFYKTIQLLTVELLTVGAVSALISVCYHLPVSGGAAFKLSGGQILKIAYLAAICTLGAQMMQIFGQKLVSANQASLILSLEAVFGTLFSVLFGAERLTAFLIIGFIIVFIAVIINETEFDFKKIFKKRGDKQGSAQK